MSKKLFSIMIVLLTICLVITACYVEYDPTKNMHPAYGTASGTGTGTAQGFVGPVKVTLTLENGYIKKAVITGNESADYGAKAIAAADKIIVATNSIELDTLSGATKTTKAIGEAGKAALASISGTGM